MYQLGLPEIISAKNLNIYVIGWIQKKHGKKKKNPLQEPMQK